MRNVLKTKTLVSFIALIIISCSSNDERESILIGSTFKVEEIENFQSDVDIVYQWWVGNKPEGSDFMFRVNGDKAFLTPDIQGDYDVYASIRDANDIELHLLEFHYTAVPDTLLQIVEREVPVEPKEPKPLIREIEEEIDSVKLVPKEKIKTTESSPSLPSSEEGWTIQVSSRSSIELARKDQIFLEEEGFDSYIQKVDFPENNQTWFRVRVGNFTDKANAKIVQEEIQKIWKYDIWIDRVRAE